MECPVCKKEVEDLSMFCTYCGCNIKNTSDVICITKKEKIISILVRVLSVISVAVCLFSIVNTFFYFDLFDDFVVKFSHVLRVVENFFLIIFFIFLLINKVYCNKKIMIGIFSATYVISIVSIAIFFAYDTPFFQNDVGLFEKIVRIIITIVSYEIFIIIGLAKNKKIEKIASIVICITSVIGFILDYMVNSSTIFSALVSFVIGSLPLILIFLLYPVLSEPLPSSKIIIVNSLENY